MYEVLAPVGSFNELGVILNEKPDAVYVGMKGLHHVLQGRIFLQKR